MKHSILILILIIGCTPPGRPVRPNVDAAKDFDSLYAMHCAGCHGTDGKYGPAPQLNDSAYLQIIARESDPAEVIAKGRSGTAMPAFSMKLNGPLTDEQVQILSKGMAAKWSSGTPSTIPGVAYKNGGNPMHGKTLYAEQCSHCHGMNGEGSADGPGSLNSPAYLQLVSDHYLWQVCVIGRPDLGCVGKRPVMRMSAEDGRDLTAYLNTWRTTP